MNAYVKSSPLYRNTKSLELTQNMTLEALRQDPQALRESLEFPSFLFKVRDGKVGTDEQENIQLPYLSQSYSRWPAYVNIFTPTLHRSTTIGNGLRIEPS